MIVAASSECFPQLSLQEVLDKLADLEYTSVELVVAGE
ncbi:MAG TPA: sugar phosphate isomerase/epimerase, partial [Planctomycetaceae bacterium]|nr:sugar phosphate isomerase/epimerase [Planctomycetaceae bacterium]